jgi:DNA-binding CsgD family transcriptional regulator
MDLDRSGVEASVSEREIEIIGLVAQGLTDQEIAQALTISKRTVDNHVSNIFDQTGAKNRVALLNWAMDNGKICRDGFNCCSPGWRALKLHLNSPEGGSSGLHPIGRAQQQGPPLGLGPGLQGLPG